MKSYIPGEGSYKAEEAGALTGVGTTGGVDHSFGTLAFSEGWVRVRARGIDIALDASFNSDHLYSCGVINRIAKYERPSATLMTLPPEQTNFYRIADGFSWDLPWVQIGEKNIFRICTGGRIFNLESAITDETWGETAGFGKESWTEGYHVIRKPTGTGSADFIIVIPEILMTVTCRVSRSGGASPYDYTVDRAGFAAYRADGSMLSFNDKGYLTQVTDPAGRNTLAFTYESIRGAETGAFSGNLALGSTAASIVLQEADYAETLAGDLITIGDETRVVFAKKGSNAVAVSGAFDIPPDVAAPGTYTVHKGRIKKIAHSDGRQVKFYYYASEYETKVAVLLSSVPEMDTFAAGDLFLGRIVINTATNRLTRFEQVNTVEHETISGFEAALRSNDSAFLAPVRAVSYVYALTAEPDPSSDYIKIVNQAGGEKTYRFQKSGFIAHAYNTKRFHTGVVRRGSERKRLIVERPDFPVKAGDWINLSRFSADAFADASKDNYLRDKNQQYFTEDDWKNFDTAKNAKPVSDWIQVSGAENANTLNIGGSGFAEKPRQNDVYAVLSESTASDGHWLTQTSTKCDRVYVDYGSYGADDYIFLRCECRRITGVGTEAATSLKYADVDRGFSFTPLEHEDALFVGSGAMGEPEFSVYYLNKPKVIKVEEKQTEDDREWKAVSYTYFYECADTPFADDEYHGGFSFSDVEGPTNDHDFPASKINLLSTSIITKLQKNTGEEIEYTRKNIFFDYDAKDVCRGTAREAVLRTDGREWVFVEATEYENGRPCRNSEYYGVVALSWIKGSVPDTSTYQPAALGNTYAESYRFDAWGRRVMTRSYSPSYEGRSTYLSFVQYAVACDADDIDPLNRFGQNPFKDTYILVTGAEKKYCLNRVAATIDQVAADGTEKIVYRGFALDTAAPANSTLNLTAEQVVEKTALPLESGESLTVDFRATIGSEALPPYSEDRAGYRWTLPGMTPAYPDDRSEPYYDFGRVRFSRREFPMRDRVLNTGYSYDAATNNLVGIVKPEGNEINLTYGTGVKSSLVVKDYQVLDENFAEYGGTQYIVNSYGYDLKGRLTEKTSRFKTDTADDDNNLCDPALYPTARTGYAYDGADRLLRTIGRGSAQQPISLRVLAYDEEARTVTLTDSLGMRTRSFYDRLYRLTEVRRYKPSKETGADFDAPGVHEVLIGRRESRWNAVDPKPFEEIIHTDETDSAVKTHVTRYDFDRLGRVVRARVRNTDPDYGGSDIEWKLVYETEYEDRYNTVTTRSYRSGGEGAGFVLTQVENDWLGRGPVREHTWTGINGTGEKRTVSRRYDRAGNVVSMAAPSGEIYRYAYNNLGMLERIENPDGSTFKWGYDKNGNPVDVKDRNDIILVTRYNRSDMPIETINPYNENRYSFTRRVSAYCHFGRARSVVYEDESLDPPTSERYRETQSFNRFGQVSERGIEADSRQWRVAYGYDEAGNPASLGVISGPPGAVNWTKSAGLSPRYISEENAEAHYLESAVLGGTNPLFTQVFNFAGLAGRVNFAASSPVSLSYAYDKFLRLVRAASGPSFDLNLNRDFAGNITRRYEPRENPSLDRAYGYDGMNRLSSGEGRAYTYDELSNILTSGAAAYTYQQSGRGDQQRLSKAEDGEGSHAYEYDGNRGQGGQGNATKITGRFERLVYDDSNRLREITREDGQIDSYRYTADGLRFRRAEDVTRLKGDTRITYTVYEGNHILLQEEYADDGTAQSLIETRLNLLSLLRDRQSLAQYRKVYGAGEELFYFANDQIGSRRAVYASDGTASDRFAYSAYGEKEHSPQPHEFLASFSGKEYDGTGLIYFNARYYDPATGRFLSEDPARDGVSWYGYCGGNPIGWVDPWGLDQFTDQADRNSRYETDKYVRQKNAERLDQERPSLTGVPSFPYVWPTESRRITSDYRSDPKGHPNELDIGAVKQGVKGDPLYAIADGEIETIGMTNGSSRLILLMENGHSAAYFHGEFPVTEGSAVKQGDIIGTMSDVGSEGQVHLHFEIRPYNDYSKRNNPYYYYPRFYEFPEKLYELPYR